MPDLPTDAYFKKEVTLTHDTRTLRFRVSDALFSSHDIDDGTRLLLKTLTPDILEGRNRALDVGCGYGPVGIVLAATGAQDVDMVDRDALAVAYTEQNAALNDIDNVHAHGSLGYDDVRRHDYDLIVSNIPAKAGAPVIQHLLLDARHYLTPDGLVAVVVIAPIAAAVEAVLRGDAGVVVVLERRARGYTVFHYQFTGEVGERNELSGFERGLYGDEVPPAASKWLLEATPQERLDSAIVLNPSPGIVSAINAERTYLIGRDLLWLEASLVAGASMEFEVGVEQAIGMPAKLILVTLTEDEGPQAHQEQCAGMVERLMRGGTMIIAGTSTAITRAESSLKTNKLVRVEDRKRKRGESVLILSSKL